MAKAGVITDVVAPSAQKQIDALVDKLSRAAELIEKANAGQKSGGGAASQRQANQAMDEAAKLTQKLAEAESQQAKNVALLKYQIQQKNREQKEAIEGDAKIVGAYKALDTELKKLRNAYKDLAASGKANTAAGKEMLANVQKLDKQIKQLDSSVGQHQRNVGNYKSAMDGLAGSFQGMPGPIKQVGTAIQTVGRLLIANPIILIVTAITAAIAGLVDAFKRTDDGGTELAARFAQITAVVDVVLDRVGRLAAGFYNILKGNFSDGFDQISNSFSGISEQMNSAAKAAYQYVYAMDAINDRITSFISQESQLRNEIAKLMYTSKDQTKTDQERKEALEQALEKEKEISNFKKKSAEEIYQAKLKEVATTLGANSELLGQIIDMDVSEIQSARSTNKVIADIWNRAGDDRLKELEELRAKMINADTEYYESTTRAYGKLTGFEKEMADTRLKVNAEFLKAKKDQEEAAAKESRENLNNDITDALRLVRAIGGEATLGVLKPKETTIPTGGTQSISQQPTPISATAGETATGLTEGEKYMLGLENEISAEAEAWNQKIQIAADAVAKIDSLINQHYANRYAAIDLEAQKDQEAKDKELAAAGNNTAAIRAINDRYDAKEKEREKEKRRLQKEQAKYQKTSSLISAIINTALGVTAALANPGGILGIVIAALAAATGIAQIALIASQPLPSYRKGRRGGKAEIAQINEAGQEAIVTREGDMYLPNGNIAYLPEGSSVIPHHELVDLSGRAATMRGVPRWEQNSTGVDVTALVNEMRRVGYVIKNKRENYISLTERGIQRLTRDGNTWTEWVNDRVL